MAISFNGGKDCAYERRWPNDVTDLASCFQFSGTVLLYLLAAVLASGNASTSRPHVKIRSLYVTCEHPFDAVEAFVEECCTRYNLDLVRIGGGMKEALVQYLGPSSLSSAKSPMCIAEHVSNSAAPGEGVKAIMMGTRRMDPRSGM